MKDSPHWNREDGVCTKHYLPSVPCPQCLATGDEDMFDTPEPETALDLNADHVSPATKPKRRAKREFRWNTHHFPVGTQFTLSDEMMRMHSYQRDPNFLDVWTCAGLVRNGCGSYVIKTGIEHVMGTTVTEHSFNMSHVKAVVKRGTGPVIIDPNWYGSNRWPTAEDRARLDRDIELAQSLEHSTRGIHATYSPMYYVIREARKIAAHNSALRQGLMIEAALANTWCREIKRDQSWHIGITLIDKKRLRRWLKQNVNRFLERMDKALEAEEAMNEEMYRRDMEADDREWERRHGHPADDPDDDNRKPAEDEGSHYDHEDGYRRDEQARHEFRQFLDDERPGLPAVSATDDEDTEDPDCFNDEADDN